ncbi:MAG TPA: hypothetical protein VJ803_09335 [Gemmatimonadaceae bacterium]|nr:hypothetical protein [Gemmatimonadaceae bacterium]
MSRTDATMLLAGSMIGSGIFIVSPDIARRMRETASALLPVAVGVPIVFPWTRARGARTEPASQA